jgi:hypothetical protein
VRPLPRNVSTSRVVDLAMAHLGAGLRDQRIAIETELFDGVSFAALSNRTQVTSRDGHKNAHAAIVVLRCSISITAPLKPK